MPRRRLRSGMLSLFVMFMLCFGALAPVSAQFVDVTPEVTAEATTEPAATTEAPAEPTAAPAEPTTAATEQAPTETAEPTVAPTDDAPVDSAGYVYGFQINLLVCTDTERAGETDFFVSDDFVYGADSSSCAATNLRNGEIVGVEVGTTGMSENVYADFSSNGSASLSGIRAGDGFIGVYGDIGQFASTQLTFEEDRLYQVFVVTFVDGTAAPTPTTAGSANVVVAYQACDDSSRAGTMDVAVTSYGAAATECTLRTMGRSELTLTSVAPTAPYSETEVVYPYGSTFQNVPWGTYTLTDGLNGVTSDPFVIGENDATSVQVLATLYLADPVLAGRVIVGKLVCLVPEGDPRVGQTDFDVLDISGYYGAAEGDATTCEGGFYVEAGPYPVTLNGPNGYSESDSIGASSTAVFEGLEPGDYTVTEVADGGPVTSAPFAVESGSDLEVLVTNWIVGDQGDPVFDDDEVNLSGVVVSCESDTRINEVEFVVPAVFEAAGTATCEIDSSSTGYISYAYFGDDEAGPSATPEYTSSATRIFTSFLLSDVFETAQQGWYQITYSPDAFGGASFSSEIFALGENSFYTSAIIKVYGVESQARGVYLQHHYCENPARANETDVYVGRVADADSEIPVFATDDSCVPATTISPGTYTLTDVETGDSIDFTFTIGNAWSYLVSGVGPGTYTVSGSYEGPDGPLTFTSDPFTVTAEDIGDVVVDAYSYVGEGDLSPREESDGEFTVRVYTCGDDARVGEFDFFTSLDFGGIGGIGGLNAAADATTCVADGETFYAFTLIGQGDEEEIAAATSYGLSRDTTEANAWESQQLVEGDTYILTEATTGFVSEPFVMTSPGIAASLYIFQAIPTPTPSPTLEPGVTPTATATVDPSEPTRIVENPPGDGSGNPDDPDGGDDSDGNDDGADGGGSGGSDTGSGSGGDVTSLPSTGQGQATSNSLLMVALLLAGVTLLGGAALTARRKR